MKPIIHRKWYSEKIAEASATLLDELVFIPLDGILSRSLEFDMENSFAGEGKHPMLKWAILAGIVMLDAENGQIKGNFTAAISKEIRGLNGKWDNNTKSFIVRPEDLPVEIIAVAADSNLKRARIHNEAISFVESALDNLPVSAIDTVSNETLQEISEDLREQLAETASGVSGLWVPSIPTQTILDRKEAIAEAQRGIVEKTLLRIKRDIEGNKDSLSDIDRLSRLMKNERDMAKLKIEESADQQASEYVAEHRKILYKPIGMEAYVWRTCGDEKVRDGHKALNGRVFKWDDPPIEDPHTGHRAHPGEAMNCRCTAVPLI